MSCVVNTQVIFGVFRDHVLRPFCWVNSIQSSNHTVTLSVTWPSGAQFFTCVIDLLIDQERRPFDVVLGFDWFQHHPTGSQLPIDEIKIGVSSLRFMFDFGS